MEKGAEYEKEGLPGWLQNDLFEFISEELADLANYAELLFYRVSAMKEVYLASGIDPSFQSDEPVPYELPYGPGTFVGKSGLPGFLPKGRGIQDPG